RGQGSSRFSPPWARMAAAIVLVVAIGLVVRKLRRRSREPSRRLHPDEKRALELWRRARQRLVRAGVDLRPGVTPRDAVRRAAALGGPVQAAATKLVARYLAARWGGAALPASDARELLRDLDRSL